MDDLFGYEFDSETMDLVLIEYGSGNQPCPMIDMLVDTLKRYREGGKQTIQVQHVNVNEGGQALVGNVKTGGADG